LKCVINDNIIETNQQTFITFEVLDSLGRVYSIDQYHYMNFELIDQDGTSYQRERSGLRIFKHSTKANQFQVIGQKKGDYKIILMLKLSNKVEIKSEILELEVFNKLTSHPSQVLLSIGCESSLLLLEGPSPNSKIINRFSPSINDIVQIELKDNKQYLLKAKSKGEIKILFESYLNDSNTVLANHSINIKVQEVNNVKILGMNERVLHLNTQIRLIV
jgi:hypothetical protein